MNMKWKQLETIEQVENLIQESFNLPLLIFKHSTRCGISRYVLKNFEADFNLQEIPVECYFLDLLNHRDVSNYITEYFSIEHQSPQILVLKNGKVIFHESHHLATVENVKNAL